MHNRINLIINFAKYCIFEDITPIRLWFFYNNGNCTVFYLIWIKIFSLKLQNNEFSAINIEHLWHSWLLKIWTANAKIYISTFQSHKNICIIFIYVWILIVWLLWWWVGGWGNSIGKSSRQVVRYLSVFLDSRIMPASSINLIHLDTSVDNWINIWSEGYQNNNDWK